MSDEPPRIFTVNGTAADPDKAKQWAELWTVKYSARYQQSGYRGMFQKQRPKQSPEPSAATGGLSSRETILALERQINAGQQLSEQGAPVLGLKP